MKNIERFNFIRCYAVIIFIVPLLLSNEITQHQAQQIIYRTPSGYWDTIPNSGEILAAEFEGKVESIIKRNYEFARIIDNIYPKAMKRLDSSWNYYLDNIRFNRDSIYLLIKPISVLQQLHFKTEISEEPLKPVYHIIPGSYEFVFTKNYKFLKKRRHTKSDTVELETDIMALKESYGLVKTLMYISTDPPFAEVRLNGNIWGETPTDDRKVESGTYRIQIKLKSYAPIDTVVYVSPGSINRYNFNFK